MQYTNVQAEKTLIRYALADDEKMAELSVRYPPKLFTSPPLVKIYILVLTHYDRYGKRVTSSELLSALDKESFKDDERETYSTLAKSLFIGTPEQDYKFCKEEVVKLFKARSIMNAIRAAGDNIDNGRLNDGEKTLRDVLDEPLFGGADNVVEYEFSQSVDLVTSHIKDMKAHPEKFVYIPTGIPQFDAHLKGLAPAEVGLVLGRTAGFKSTALYNFAIESYMSGHDTALITIEMSGEQILRRLYGRVARIDITSLDEAFVSDEELARMNQVVKQYGERKKNKLHVIDVATGCTIDFLKAKIKQLQRTCKLEMVVVDYMQIMETRAGEVDLYDWKANAIISKKLKETARQFNVAIWSAAQEISGGQFRKGEDSTDDVAFSKSISQNVDVLVKIVQSADQKLLKEAEMKTLKLRRKGLCPPILLKPDPAFGQLHQGG